MTVAKKAAGPKAAKKSAAKKASSAPAKKASAKKSSEKSSEPEINAGPAVSVPGRPVTEPTSGTGRNGSVLPVDKSGLHGVSHDVHNPAFAVDTSK